MPFISINESPLMPGVTPVQIHYREFGTGTPLIFLHGGWGYEVYSFDSQIEAFSDDLRILIPDRSGYGRSMRIGPMPVDFHRRAAVEMMNFLDALKIERAFLWGHSDGAVIATMMGLSSPDRFSGIILEAFHLYRVKPGSGEFFETMAHNPDMLGERICSALARDHGEDYFRELIINNGRAWLRIAEESNHPKQDLYNGRLGELAVPTLFIHGSADPRTEPDELSSVRQQFNSAQMHIIEGGGHSPHSQKSVASECNQVAGDFLRKLIGF
ncbi:MAG TPA: alpha/beta hydrolase [Blastocatellia bacterium]|nr:alpha/beta hydrolase [Blastocatellia bacterium]